MSSLPQNASQEDLEEELAFQEVLLQSLDEGSDNYWQRKKEIEDAKIYIEHRLELLAYRPLSQQSQPSQRGAMGSDGANDHSWWQTAVGTPRQSGNNNTINNNSSGGSSFGSNTPSGSSGTPSQKRPLTHSGLRPYEPRAKRSSPGPSTPSSVDSLEMTDPKDTNLAAERARQRQRQYTEDLQRRGESQLADEAFARQLSQTNPRPSGSTPRLSYGGVQTTIGDSGRYSRPPPSAPRVKAELPAQNIFGRPLYPPQDGILQSHNQVARGPVPSTDLFGRPAQQPIKAEPGSYRPSQVAQRPRQLGVVDLTGDSDDDDVEVTSSRLMPSQQQQRPLPGQQFNGYDSSQVVNFGRVPGAYPSLNAYAQVQNAYLNPASTFSSSAYGAPPQQQQPGYMQNFMNSVRGTASWVGDELSELTNLIHGGSSNGPINLDDDDGDDEDLVYQGSRSYAGYGDLYHERYRAIEANDPAKTKEEINALLENIRPDEDLPEHLMIRTPDAMSIKLHKYQELGLTWLQNMENGSNKGGILADDMGLGKTIQMLSLIVSNKSDDIRCKTTLIVAPVALMRQWKQEIQNKIKPGRHALTVYTHHGASKKTSFRELQMFDIVLTTFGSVAAEVRKHEKFRLRQVANPDAREAANEKCALIGPEAQWYRVILDEAQCIKNKNTQAAKGACLLNAKFRFCMTGTPMMNSVEELYSLIKFLRIKPYNQWEKFNMEFVKPLKSSNNEDYKSRAMRQLQALLKALLLRRTKKSLYEGKPILSLPERTTEMDNPDFDEDESTFYQALENKTQLQFNKYLRAGTIGNSYSYILVLLLRLRQACCHPHLIRDFGVSATADVTPEDLKTFAKELSDAVVTRIKEANGSFECPICMDAFPNPAIFIPCGHSTCQECFARIADPSNAIAQGNDGVTAVKCPACRGDVNPKRITDYSSFKAVHLPHEISEVVGEDQDDEKKDSETESEADSDSSTESEDEDGDDTLGGFIVRDDVEDDDATESEAGDGEPGPSNGAPKKPKKKTKSKKKSKKAKGKEKEKPTKAMTLAELKKAGARNASAKRKYLRRLRRDYVSSAKIDKTMDILKDIMATPGPEGEKTIIFSQWTSLLDLLEVPVDREGWGYRRYDGSMNAKMRGDAVDDFGDRKKDVRIMLVSLKAGNAGLNLNMASQVIILDPFWNPYIEEQAIDRAHRLGQTRPVTVHRVLVKGTVEDRIIDLQEKKRALISEALDEKASQSMGRLGARELAYLFGITRNVDAPLPQARAN